MKIKEKWVSWEELLPGFTASTTVDFNQIGGLAPGSIPFADATGFLTQDNANFFWDETNLRFGIGTATPDVAFDLEFDAVATVVARISAQTRPWWHWECVSGDWGLAIGIDADDDIIHFHYDTPIGTEDTCFLVFDGGNTRVGILDDTPGYPLDIGGNTNVQGTLRATGAVTFLGTLGVTGLITATAGVVGPLIIEGFGIPGGELQFVGPRASGQCGITYEDSGTANRLMLLVQLNQDIVELLNRAANGTVEIHANTAVAGVGGDVKVVEIQDTDVILSDGIGFNLQEDITFLGATTENQIIFPDNLADALSFLEGANPYLTFVTTNGSEAANFGVNLSTIGTIAGTTAKLSNLTDGYIPYHVSDAVGLANGPIFTDATNVSIGTTDILTSIYIKKSSTGGAGGTYPATRIINTNVDITGVNYSIAGSEWATLNDVGGVFMSLLAVSSAGASYGRIGTVTSHDLIFIANGAEGIRLSSTNNVGINQATFGTNATKTLALGTGVAPTTSPADCFQMYSADIGGVAGKAGAHFRDEEGNVVSIGSGGLLSTGTARVLKRVFLNNAAFTKGSTAPTQVILGFLNGWEFDIGDDAVMTSMMPDDWDETTAITIKVCWYIDEAYAADKEIQWRVDWSAIPHDFSETVDAPTHTGNISSGDINIPAVAKRMGTSTVGIIAAANLAAGDMLGFKLSRIAVTHDNPTNDPTAHHLAIEYTSNKLGVPT